jgi:hypothetical protein
MKRSAFFKKPALIPLVTMAHQAEGGIFYWPEKGALSMRRVAGLAYDPPLVRTESAT